MDRHLELDARTRPGIHEPVQLHCGGVAARAGDADMLEAIEVLCSLQGELDRRLGVLIAGRAEPGSRRTCRRLARYRTGFEGRISHLKRGYGLRRSRLRGDQGQRIWTGWAVLAYNLDTLAIHAA